MRNIYVSIAGVMGSGKTTVAQLLAERLGFELVQEEVETNPFLERFYVDPTRWVLASELFFLSSKIRNVLCMKKVMTKQSVVGDTPILQDVYSYAKTQHDNGNMADDEWQLYQDTYSAIAAELPTPDAVVYLQTSIDNLVKRIAKRNRPYEKNISKKDLLLLEKNNQAWMQKFKSQFPILTITTDDKNFVDSETDITNMTQMVKDFITNSIN